MLHTNPWSRRRKPASRVGFLRLCPILILALLTLVAAPAWSQPNEADRATARVLAADGYRALQGGDYQTAEDRFRRADALVHAPTLVVDHARALVGLRRLVEAHERYELVLREGVPSNAPPAWKRALEDAQRELTALKPRLAWLTVAIGGPSEPTVTINQKRVPPAALGVRRATDPGTVKVSATAQNYLPEARELTLAEGEEKSIEIELSPSPAAPGIDRVLPTEPPRAVTAEPAPSRPRWLTYGAFGLAGVGLVFGTVTGILALDQHSTLKPQCPDDTCPDRLQGELDRYHTLGTLSGIGFGVGIAGAAVGTALLLTGHRRENPQPPRAASIRPWASVRPSLGPTSVGLQGTF